jgi:hypothetical protein
VRGFSRSVRFLISVKLPDVLPAKLLAMSTCLLDTVLPALTAPPLSIDAEGQTNRIASSVHSALYAVDPSRKGIERRRDSRYPYPYPIHLTPIGADGQPEALRTFVVIGKHLSSRGVDFYFRLPLPERRVIASLDCGREGWIGLLLELAWCRFSRHGWYDNGGRFLAVVTSPLLALDRLSA